MQKLQLTLTISKKLLSAILLLTSSTVVYCEGVKMQRNVTEIDSGHVSNTTAFFNETRNETAYQCQGASKEDLRIYEDLAWWMDAVCQVMKSLSIKNGMLRHSLGGAVILFSLQHFIAPALGLLPCLPSRQNREAIKALNSF